MGLFGKTPQKDPKDLVREWSSTIRKEGYKLDRQIRTIRMEEEKVMKTVKDAAKKGQLDVAKLLAREVVNSKKAVSKLYASKAQMGSIEMKMKEQLATLRVSGCLQQSSEVMRYMNNLIKIPEIQQTMQEMSKEMMKAGLIEEMVQETFEGMEDQEELEDAADAEVEKILFEVTNGLLGKVKDPTNTLQTPRAEASSSSHLDEDLNDMKARLDSLRS